MENSNFNWLGIAQKQKSLFGYKKLEVQVSQDFLTQVAYSMYKKQNLGHSHPPSLNRLKTYTQNQEQERGDDIRHVLNFNDYKERYGILLGIYEHIFKVG